MEINQVSRLLEVHFTVVQVVLTLIAEGDDEILELLERSGQDGVIALCEQVSLKFELDHLHTDWDEFDYKSTVFEYSRVKLVKFAKEF